MKNLAIVAIPSIDDIVWRFSSEKVPHLTILYLGDQSDSLNTDRMEQFVEHVVNTSMHKFGLSVSYRGNLGDKDADVLFFDKEYMPRMLEASRSYFLSDPDIKRAYVSTEQFPTWIPHLTMGYPESPAKIDDRDYPGINWVNFDRIAFWTGDYEGPEFKLDCYRERGLSMSEIRHYGVKGMHWGVRRDTAAKAIKVGVKALPAAKAGLNALNKKYVPDETKSAFSVKVGEAGGLHKVSDKELQAMLSRMEMERKYKNFMSEEGKRQAEGKNATLKFLVEAGKLVIPLALGGGAGTAAASAASKVYSYASRNQLTEGQRELDD